MSYFNPYCDSLVEIEEPVINADGILLHDVDGKKKSQSTLLIEIGGKCVLFHCPQKDAYAEISEQGITKVYPLRSKDFREYLGHKFYELTERGACTTSLTDAINTLEAMAKHHGEECSVFLRIANLDDRIYIDLGCDKWRIVEITKAGWKVLDKSPVKFYRRRGMAALPAPIIGGNIDQLTPFINANPDDFKLMVGWVLATLGGIKPYPILILQGEQGTGKSTTCRVLRMLTDPSSVPLRSPPKEIKDLLVSASNNYVVVLDNLSGLSADVSDCLCRLSTGGGIDVRSLYTDNEQNLIDIQRPILVNGIDDIAARPDLSERSIHIELPLITDKVRVDEKAFYADFDKVKGGIFGALLSQLAIALLNIGSVRLENKPRMADFAKWVVAAENGIGWQSGEFMAAYRKNQDEAITVGIESSPVGMAIMDLVDREFSWTGTPTELLNRLECISDQRLVRSRAWPQSTKGLNNAIKRLMPSFRRMGIDILKEESKHRRYTIRRAGI